MSQDNKWNKNTYHIRDNKARKSRHEENSPYHI